MEAKTTKKLPKRYVYSEIWVFWERRTPKRSDEPDDIPFVSFDGKQKKNEEADEANFDEPFGIFCGHEKSRTDFECSGATPVDVSALYRT